MAVKGLNATIQRLRKMDARIQQEVKEELFDTGQEIAQEAMRNLGRNRSHTSKGEETIAKQINVFPEVRGKGFSIAIIAHGPKNFPAYREFGTGLSAASYVPSLPKEWQSLAMLFYVNGKGTMVKQPYLYPAYFKHVPILMNNLKAMLKREAKR